MKNATFIVYFEDINYERWIAAHGMTGATLEPRRDGLFDLKMVGTQEQINQFAAELGWGPEAQA